jgi:MFS family permease
MADLTAPDEPDREGRAAAAAAPAPFFRRGALRHPGYRLFWISRLCSTFAALVVSVAVGWQVYDLTRNPLDLGLVGLVQFSPSLLLVLVTGTASDRINRRAIIAVCLAVEALVAALFLALTAAGTITVGEIFVLLVVFGTARAFLNPAAQSLLTNLVPTEDLANAIAWNSTAWQTATILGPVAGGLLYGASAEVAYGAAVLLFGAAAALVAQVPRPAQRRVAERPSWTSLVAGFRYVWHEKIVLGAISLDLFAVLLGGATALLPAYARDILVVGPWGLGLLRAAPGFGAMAVVFVLGARPIRDHAGAIMFVAVALFGVFTTLFGASTAVWLSVLALALMGATDMVSVFVRETLIQLWTPDAVRGRVSAVNMVFVGASNELGEFRAGIVAALIGVVPAVLIGGLGTITVAALWAWWFPQLRRVRYLDGRKR